MVEFGRTDPDALARDDAAARPLGGRVERTGLGLVRRGEVVVPAGDGGADIRPTPAQGAALTLEFAVTIEVGPSTDEIAEAAADVALRRLREALSARALG
ncbi:hypothetical protein [Microbacterium sp. 10M-3C3]|jgi:hypothetical protein|uniref:hypothetical protein n=1 Tax=Microbacterium sp. 10M-3C3 TaxID=2483401 RepID=UPI000F633AE7|nr:hypothetical protein [Microbacterium sp. 10M-3C3]